MTNALQRFLKENMVLLPEGQETIRKFTDPNKWISSNYKMSIPSRGNSQNVRVEEVHVESFYMAKYPVTNEFYHKIIGSKRKDDRQLPKVNISWLDAINFCNAASLYYGLEVTYSMDDSGLTFHEDKNGFYLPSDAQWQYACKGDLKKYQYDDIDLIAWHGGNSNNQLHAVGLKKANSWGLYDMLGNVWEWCFDLYNADTYHDYRLFRGGSFAEEARICGATTRRKSFDTFAIDDLGLRLAKSL
jgi:formylglycine-generating enzyme required for sulfatase activity